MITERQKEWHLKNKARKYENWKLWAATNSEKIKRYQKNAYAKRLARKREARAALRNEQAASSSVFPEQP